MERDNNTAASIRDLQHMLDRLSRRYPQLPRLVETGIFDELTLEAVMIFQRDFGLPVTGVVDHDSWYAIVEAYRDDLLHYGAPAPLLVLPDGEFSTGAGEASEPVRIAQALFCALSVPLVNFGPCETDLVNQGATQNNLLLLQQLAGLPETGNLDRVTWEYLTRHYLAYVVRDARSAYSGPAVSAAEESLS